MKKNIICTAALPYANGPIHIGHLVEYLQVDFWTRFKKMQDHNCLYICADDAHGTPIMLKAKSLNITPQELTENMQKEHLKDFSTFEIQFDHYSSTNTSHNKDICYEVYESMKKNIVEKNIEQLYCNHDKMFLPDRFTKGTCPKCKAEEQNGDSCDVCGSTYSPTEVLHPQCSICGNTPVLKESSHLFYQLENFREFLKLWIKEHTPKEVQKKLQEWLEKELSNWDISRDKPYFGFEIPEHKDKFFYVWLDAPLAYLASTKEWAEKQNINFKAFWNAEDTEIYHFIGKDIVYFHCLFFPSMLKNSDYKLANNIFVHGHLTFQGKKMSKSKGTLISAKHFAETLNPLYLRYYLASKLNANASDIDFSIEDFTQKTNAELLSKITNLASRSIQMLNKKLDNKLSCCSKDGLLLIKKIQNANLEIAKLYNNREFSKALGIIRSLAEEANQYFDKKEPWKSIKNNSEEAHQVLTDIVNVFRILTIYLTPILPSYSKQVAALFNEDANYKWSDHDTVLENCDVQKYEHLLARIDSKDAEKLVVTA
ncbi:MAG: methionine--tRNA ligase [Bdellovibrionaceae bacterium]|nr:methionine--tRNA ligase [Pseudobdellovibrionaceae bacterium]